MFFIFTAMKKLLTEIRACTVCTKFLPNKPHPIVQAGIYAKIVIIGQAPGQKVQDSGIPWDDASGNELRRWLGVSKEQFYNDKLFALVPMGFCYPGKGTSGDLPPRPECAPLWHEPLLKNMKKAKLIILIGQYSLNYYLGEAMKSTLTDTVRNYNEYLPNYFPLVHPSPRNRIWQSKNPWFEKEIVPILRIIISTQISETIAILK
jgi:uracil-DNA glycosylase